MSIIDHVRQYHDELTAIRRDIHAHPELGMEEERTSALVAEKLKSWGLEVHRDIGKTGVVGTLRVGNNPRSIGLRADMDALPIIEANDVDYRSTYDGKMHACGHDGHTAMLLGAARYLAETKNFEGCVHFIFQPAEEGLGGALAMVEDGLFERFPCDTVFGMHNHPGLPAGEFGIRPGPMMAGGALFDVKISGRGSHGARPEGSIDPITVAAHIVSACQTIVSRNISARDTAVLSVTQIHAGDAYNVIPEEARLMGTARAFSSETMKKIEDTLRRTVEGVASGLGAKAELDFRFTFAPLVNNPEETEFAADCAASLVGDEKVERDFHQMMGSEDFSFMLEKSPGAYIRIGNGKESGPVHNPEYDFNDEIIPFGVAFWGELVENKLAKQDS
ncbi:MAG: M20 family metallopeptidase [Hyphomicrobiaceae bacterium]|nr:M20 family metallopeptidase [Hyphomicrobiaceae bacterium]